MSITISCDYCGKSMKVKDSFAGKKGRCPYCSSEISVTPAKGYEQYKPPKRIVQTSNIERNYSSWVESQNEFGTQVRHHFSISIRSSNIEDGYLEYLENLPGEYGESTHVPDGKVQIRKLKIDGDVHIEPRTHYFYNPTTGESSTYH
jgi:hypothetical protein